MAQATGDQVADPSRASDGGPTAGDPDGPTGDIAPPTKGTINEPSPSTVQPVKRFTALAQWKVAFKLWARFTFVR